MKLYHITIPGTSKMLLYWEPEAYSEYRESIEYSFLRILLRCHLRTTCIYQNAIKYLKWSVLFRTSCNLGIFRTEPWHAQNLKNIWNSVNYLWCSISLSTFCNPGIFRTLVSIWCSIFLMKPEIFKTLAYFETVVYLESCQINTIRY